MTQIEKLYTLLHLVTANSWY